MVLNIDTKKIFSYVEGIMVAMLFFPPTYLEDNFAFFDSATTFMRFIIVIYFILFQLYRTVTARENCLPLLFLAFVCVLLVYPHLEKNTIYPVLNLVFEWIGVFLICGSKKKNKAPFYKGMCLYFFVVIIINYICVCLFENGLYNIGMGRKYYFFGHVNYHVVMLVLGCALNAYFDLEKNKISAGTIILAAVSELTLTQTESRLGLLGFNIFLLMLLLFLSRKKCMISGVTAFAFSIILFVSLNSKIVNNVAEYLADVFQKSEAVHSRFVFFKRQNMG